MQNGILEERPANPGNVPVHSRYRLPFAVLACSLVLRDGLPSIRVSLLRFVLFPPDLPDEPPGVTLLIFGCKDGAAGAG